MKGKGILKVFVALLLVCIVGSLLWNSSPVRAMTVDISDTSGNTLGNVIEFSVDITIEDTEALPIKGVDIYVENTDDSNFSIDLEDLPLVDGESKNFDFSSDAPAGGVVTVTATVVSSWTLGYGYGYLEWDEEEHWGYGYGYGPGPAAITYDVVWTSPGGWPAEYYEIKAVVTSADDHTFPQTKEVYLKRSAGGGGGGGAGGADKTPPRISDILHSSITKTTVDIYWTTQEKSTSQVEYWASPHEFSELDEELIIDHHVTLTGLNPGTTYTYKVISADKSGNIAESEEYSFVTAGTPANFIVRSLEITPGEIMLGEQVTISVVVQNTGDAAGDYTVNLQLDGDTVATKQVTIAGGAEQTVVFTVTGEESKTYNVDVAGLAGTFTVEVAAPTPTPATPTPTPEVPVKAPVNWWLIGGIIAVLVAVAMVVWLTLIRQRSRA